MLRYIVGRLLILVSLIFALSTCTTPPDVNYDVLRAQEVADPTSYLLLMQHQDEAIAGRPFIGGNQVTLLRDGNATYPAMLAAIKQAKHYIYMESFTFDDKAGKEFADGLIARHAAGVRVDLIYDAWGSSDTPPGIFDYMRDHGIKLTENNPVDVLSVVDGGIDQRDHRKLLVIDGQTAFVGSVNISVVYLKKKKIARFFKGEDLDSIKHLPWRDTHIKIMGPATAEFDRLFRKKWREQHGSPLDLRPAPAQIRPRGNILVQAVESEPREDHFAIYRSLLTAIDLAQHSVHLTTGYFVPTPDLIDALKKAAARGVDVSLLLPSVSDSDMALKAGHAAYSDLLEAGITIHELEGSVLHAKTAVIDGVWSTVGSSNLDWRSAAINDECNALILSPSFGAQMEAMFQDDLTKAKLITREGWEDRPFDEKLDEWSADLIGYFL